MRGITYFMIVLSTIIALSVACVSTVDAGAAVRRKIK